MIDEKDIDIAIIAKKNKDFFFFVFSIFLLKEKIIK